MISDISVNGADIQIGDYKISCDGGHAFFTLAPTREYNVWVDKQSSCICEEEKEMNKILQLYVERKEKEIHDTYEKLVEEEYNKIEFVEVYNNLVNDFEQALKDLFEDETNIGCKYMTDTELDRNTYKYRLASGRIQNEIREKYSENIREELDELHTLVNEVETMLSLANNNGNIDNAKVQEILIKYDIIDKDLKIQA